MKGSPLFRDAFALCGVLLEELERRDGFSVLRRRLCHDALGLLDGVCLALAGFDRRTNLLGADAELVTLRAHLRLASELALLDEELFLALSERADSIGRQIGGWLKKLERSP